MPLNIKRARRTVPFYPDAAVAAEIEAASDAVVAAKNAAANDGDARLASKSRAAVREAEKAFEDAKARGDATVLDVELEAVSRKRWAEIEESHPPREGNANDEQFNLNWSSFLAEVLPESVRSVKHHDSGDVEEVTEDEWAEALDEMSDGQYTNLGVAVLALNRDRTRPF
ncbi:hypothetical protein [Isoptericola sp. NPDC055881]